MISGSILVSVGISAGFLLALGLILSALLIIAEKKIMNYGTCCIDINEGERKLEVPGGGTLLSALGENNIFIPSACGGRGTCAYCKVQVTEGAGMVGPVEEPHLDPEERKNQVRLSCQVKVRKDVKIHVPKELLSVRKYKGKLLSKKPLTYDIVELRIELLESQTIDFVAGKYVQLESEEYNGNDRVMRAYSISSPPSDKNHIELIIRKVPSGICTTWIFEHLREGQEVVLSGPYGKFHLSDTDAEIIFIAGGSGMAPIWGMLRDMKEKGKMRKATYFFGALTQKDLFFVDELAKLQEEVPSFKFVPALSNEPAGSDWKGERGLITDVVARYMPDCSKNEGYLCGSPGMINACIKVLTKAGMTEDHIFYDKFA
ncbi:MAG: 2Fe-2S iron-sulfur cluster binding domain-containing protein [Candidatus Brocadia sp.]|nr:2Fe-2S iron-sulfur cluster binding domain-containing protein [Candidatus Brocadia sp.]